MLPTFILSMCVCQCDQFVWNVSCAIHEVIFPLSLWIADTFVTYEHVLWFPLPILVLTVVWQLDTSYSLKAFVSHLRLSGDTNQSYVLYIQPCLRFTLSLPVADLLYGDYLGSDLVFNSRSAPLIFRYEGSTFQDRWWSSGERRAMIYSLISFPTCREVWVIFIRQVCRCSTPLVHQTIQYLYWHTCPLNTLIMFQHIFHFGTKAVVFFHTILA